MSRKFSSSVRKAAQLRAGGRCQLCGRTKPSVCSYIHSKSPKIKHARAGSIADKAYDDNYVKSLNNAVVLCTNCSFEVNSKEGLQIVDVKYLESLNTDSQSCTSLIRYRDKWVRCHQRRANINSYRCWEHLD